MQITYLGHSSFKIKTKTATIVTDPYHKQVGFRFPKTRADICTISHFHFDHNFRGGIKNEDCFFIENPGEYEIKEIMIKGIQSCHDDEEGQKRGKNTIFLIQAENINICHLGDLGHSLADKDVKELEDVDILIIPIGGTYTIGPKRAVQLIKKIEPSIIIPVHYQQEGLGQDFAQLKPVDDFLAEIQMESKKSEKLILSSTADLPEEMEIIQLDKKE